MFQTGQKVVCINDTFTPSIRALYKQLPIKDNIYTVREVFLGREKIVKGGDTATVGLLVEECFRHCKAVLALGEGRSVIDELGLAGAGVVTGDGAGDLHDDLLTLLGGHRSWERFATRV